MALIRQYWQHALLHLLVIYGLYTSLLMDISRDFVFLVAYIPVSLLFLGFIFGCHKGFKWSYLLLVGLILLPAVGLTYFSHRSSGNEFFLYLLVAGLGQLMGWVIRSIILYFKKS